MRGFYDFGGHRIHRWVRWIWYGPESLSALRFFRLILRPLAALFALGVSVRNQAYDVGLRRSQQAGIPILSVGNLSVGGTGKTPVTRWIVGRLLARRERPAVLSRGYGKDELALHHRWNPTVGVFADPDRVSAAAAAVAAGATCGVMDDGFQHRALSRDADVVLVAAEDSFPPFLLPSGPFRESLSSLRRASLVMVTSRGAGKEVAVARWMDGIRALPQHPPVIHVPLSATGWSNLEGFPAAAPPDDGPLVGLLSIGRPEGFAPLVETLLPGAGERLTVHIYPDHYPYTEEDVQRMLGFLHGASVLTTEKDAVKLLPFKSLLDQAGSRIYVLEMGLQMDERAEKILDRILDRVLALGREG
jgi:tetraacyldisaccharide 4'-kinase